MSDRNDEFRATAVEYVIVILVFLFVLVGLHDAFFKKKAPGEYPSPEAAVEQPQPRT